VTGEPPLRVALLEPAGRGGIHHYSRALATALAAAGTAVTLVTAHDHEFRADDARQPPPFAIAPRFARLATEPRALLRTLRQLAPDLLHLQSGTHPLLHLGLLHAARAATGAPAIVTAHDLQPKNSGRVGAWCAARLHAAAAAIVVHSESLRAELVARQPRLAHRVVVVPHGDYAFLAPPAARRPAAAGAPPTLLFFGHVHPEKGLADLIAALPAIAAAQPAVRLIVAGKLEQEFAPLERLAQKLGVSARIDWRLGYVPAAELPALFAAATVVVLPYRAAAQSGVLFLAAACEKPVLATRVGALPETVVDGESGRLVAPEDPAALAAAATALIGNRAVAAEMGKKLAQRCRTEGSWSAIAAQTLALYARARGAARPSPSQGAAASACRRRQGEPIVRS